jgi:hypothetical protein
VGKRASGNEERRNPDKEPNVTAAVLPKIHDPSANPLVPHPVDCIGKRSERRLGEGFQSNDPNHPDAIGRNDPRVHKWCHHLAPDHRDLERTLCPRAVNREAHRGARQSPDAFGERPGDIVHGNAIDGQDCITNMKP